MSSTHCHGKNLWTVISGSRGRGAQTHLLRLRDHHVAIHEYARNGLGHAREDRCACGPGSIRGRDSYCSEATLTHGNVGHEVAVMGRNQQLPQAQARGEGYPSITSGTARHMSAAAEGRDGRGLTHVQPFRAALDHALAFCGELAEVRGEHRG